MRTLPTSHPAATSPTADGPDEGRRRAVVENLTPSIDCGAFPVKRTVGDDVVVEADAFTDGHDALSVVIRYRHESEDNWTEAPMEALGNDRWRASFPATQLGTYLFTVTAWVDHFASWRRDLVARADAGTQTDVDLQIGANLIDAGAERADGTDRTRLAAWAREIRASGSLAGRTARALDEQLAASLARHPDRGWATTHEPDYRVTVEPVRARFSTWYELFPRSASPDPGRPGTLRDVVTRLDYVADLGFDVLYLPPIHPIGRTFRKGRNNSTSATPDDPGVPWAIGAAEGGHDAVHPELGTLDDLRALVDAAASRGIAVALDIAWQASPDHPWVEEHPSWFRSRPDGTIQYAENPPKKYQDVYPFDFESADWPGLWQALLDVMRFWIGQGIRVFRVDNPHTKPFAYWEWAIGEIKRTDPDVLFLAEAFTRPKVMYRLAKIGFSQSYTYFTWRTTKHELTDYFTELTRPPVSEFYRPNLWPNTPDILHETLQHGGRPMFEARLILAATLGASYGIYGPAFELLEHVPREPGSEEYRNSEKYEIRQWDLVDERSIAPLIRKVNIARREHPALQSNDRLVFHPVDDEELIAYSKRSADGSDVVLTIVNLDPHHRRSGTVELRLWELGLDEDRPFEATDLLSADTFVWHGARNFVELDPATRVAHVLQLRPRLRTERQFETYAP